MRSLIRLEAGDAIDVRRADEDDRSRHAEFFEAFAFATAGAARHRDDEALGVAPGPFVRVARDAEQLRQLTVRGSVDAVADSSCEFGHLRAEPSDDHRRSGLRTREARHTVDGAGPPLTQLGDSGFDGGASGAVAGDRPA